MNKIMDKTHKQELFKALKKLGFKISKDNQHQWTCWNGKGLKVDIEDDD